MPGNGAPRGHPGVAAPADPLRWGLGSTTGGRPSPRGHPLVLSRALGRHRQGETTHITHARTHAPQRSHAQGTHSCRRCYARSTATRTPPPPHAPRCTTVAPPTAAARRRRAATTAIYFPPRRPSSGRDSLVERPPSPTENAPPPLLAALRARLALNVSANSSHFRTTCPSGASLSAFRTALNLFSVGERCGHVSPTTRVKLLL